MWCIVGLGNPGTQYAETRHNIGFMMTDLVAEKFPVSCHHTDPAYVLREVTIRAHPVLLVQPQTFMNCSGIAVEKVLRSYHESPDHLIAIYDDLDLIPGRIRIRTRGGDGGHKGVKSLIEYLDTNQFIRLRIGIGRPQPDHSSHVSDTRESVVDYVLQPFREEELPVFGEVMQQAIHAIELLVTDRVSEAMALYNRTSFQEVGNLETHL